MEKAEKGSLIVVLGEAGMHRGRAPSIWAGRVSWRRWYLNTVEKELQELTRWKKWGRTFLDKEIM